MNDWPESDPRWDVIAFRAAASPADGDPAARRLVPLIERVARDAAEGGMRSEVEEFAASAPALVLMGTTARGRRIDAYDPAQPFLPWLVVLLKRAWIDHGRRRRLRVEAVDPDRLPAPGAGPAEELPDTMFSPTQWERLRATLRADHVVEFLCLHGLTALAPEGDWEELLRTYEADRGIGLPRPFPPPEVAGLTSVKARTTPLARLFGYPLPNTLSVRRKRIVERLQRNWVAGPGGGLPPSAARTTSRENA